MAAELLMTPGPKTCSFIEGQDVWERIWERYASEETPEEMRLHLAADIQLTRGGQDWRCRCRGVHLISCPITQRHTHNRIEVRRAILSRLEGEKA